MLVKLRKEIPITYSEQGRDDYVMQEKKKSILDLRIDQFCESSKELLTGIHARHNGSKRPKKKKGKVTLNDFIDISDTDVDFREDLSFEDMP
jgi:hypothetical protein